MVQYLGTLADLASIIGLAVSVVGFWLTVTSARKAADSAEEARRAAEEMVARIRVQSLLNDIEEGLRFLNSVNRACRDAKWDEAIRDCDYARDRLAPLSASNDLEGAERQSLVAGTSFLGGFPTRLKTLRGKNMPDKTVSPGDNKTLHELLIDLGRMKGRIQAKGGEFTHGRES